MSACADIAGMLPGITAALHDMFRDELPATRVQFFIVAMPAQDSAQVAFGSNFTVTQVDALRELINLSLDAIQKNPLASMNAGGRA